MLRVLDVEERRLFAWGGAAKFRLVSDVSGNAPRGGQGPEVARLVQRSPAEVATSAGRTRREDALLTPAQGRLLSFYDLVTAEITAELRRRGVRLDTVPGARASWPRSSKRSGRWRTQQASRNLLALGGESTSPTATKCSTWARAVRPPSPRWCARLGMRRSDFAAWPRASAADAHRVWESSGSE
jgi:hypothetical protein